MKLISPGRGLALLLCALSLPLSVRGASVRAQTASGVTADSVAAAVAQLDSIARQNMAKTGVPGMAIAVVYKDQVVYLKGFGVREVGTSDPVDADTVFQLASVSKPIASTVIASVVGDHLVKWDDPIVSHDPGFQMYEPWVTSQVTLRDMLSHRSGLPDHAGDLLEDMGYDRDQALYRLRFQKPYSEEQIANGEFDQKPADPFRAQYAYTNFGFTEAGVAAAKAAGESWEDLSADRLYKPLGMSETSSRHADFLAAPNHAARHILVNGRWVVNPYDRDPDPESPAGGVSSSVRDLAQWLRLQLGGGSYNGRQLIPSAALDETHRPQIVSSPPADPSTDRASFYGLGWSVSYDDQGRVQLGHSGAFNSGAATAVFMLPSEQLGIIALTNGSPIGLPEATALSFLDLAKYGHLTRDWLAFVTPSFQALNAPTYGTEVDYSTPPTPGSPAQPDGVYTGTYHSDFFGDITISAAASGLVMTQGPQQMPFTLQHYDRDTFSYQPIGENAYGLSGVTFTIGVDGKAASVLIENLNIHGMGTFVRVAPTS